MSKRAASRVISFGRQFLLEWHLNTRKGEIHPTFSLLHVIMYIQRDANPLADVVYIDVKLRHSYKMGLVGLTKCLVKCKRVYQNSSYSPEFCSSKQDSGSS